MTDLMLKHALEYAKLGWHVAPLVPGKKVPLTKHGISDATADAKRITDWWVKTPDANIALACGKKSGIYVVDIDIDSSKGISGFDSLKAGGEKYKYPITASQDTPRGGLHLFFETADPPANKNGFLPGVDIRGDGYYVVLAPSRLDPYDGCAGGGEYQWRNGLSPWEILPAPFPNTYRPEKKEVVVAPVAPTVARPIGGDTVERASRYLAECDPAIQGQAGHEKLLYAAGRLVNGFLLSDSQAYSLLASEYNPRCEPPWNFNDATDERDFRRKISEARRIGSSRGLGWLLDDDTYTDHSGQCVVDIGAMMVRILASNAAKNEIESGVAEKVELSDEEKFLTQPTGLLGEICSWINAGAMRQQPLLTLACSLAWLGALFGRKIESGSGSRTNIYCMGVAKSSAGKDHAPRQIRRLAHASGNINLIGGSDLASDSAIEERMAKEPSTIFMIDEIGHLLSSVKSGRDKHKIGIVSTLMRLYSSAQDVFLGKEYANQEMQRVISEPCCCLYGTATPDRFQGGLSASEIDDGWLSRCLVFYSDTFPEKLDVRKLPIPAELIERCAAWAQAGKPTGLPLLQHCLVPGGGGEYVECARPSEALVVNTNREAKIVFDKLESLANVEAKRDPSVCTIWLKAEENARKIALIVAASENLEMPKISESIADYSCRLVLYLVENFLKVVVPEIARNSLQTDKRHLAKLIDSYGIGGCTRSQLTKRTQWTNRRSRNDMLDDLFEAGEVSKEPDGRTIRMWSEKFYMKVLAKRGK